MQYLAPRIYERGAPQGRGGVCIFAEQICRNARFAKQSGQNPSVTMASGFAHSHCDTSPINRGGKGASIYFISSQTSLVYSTGSSMGRSAIRQA